MNVEQLTTALARHDPDPDGVMAAFHSKRRAATRRRIGAAGVLAVAAAAVLLLAVQRPWASGPAARPAAGSQAVADGCASVPLPETLAMARQGGASVIVATGSLTGTTAVDGQVYYGMTLRSVRTLSGPTVRSSSTAWIASGRGPSGPIPGTDGGSLWATDGGLFGIVWPAQRAGTTVGPILRIAPVVDGRVVLSSAGCWDVSGLSARPFHGRLAEIPGSNSYARAAANGFHAVDLSTLEGMTAR